MQMCSNLILNKVSTLIFRINVQPQISVQRAGGNSSLLIHQDVESVEKWAVRLSKVSKINAFKISEIFSGNPGKFREL